MAGRDSSAAVTLPDLIEMNLDDDSPDFVPMRRGDELLWAGAYLAAGREALDQRFLGDATRFCEATRKLADRHDSLAARRLVLESLFVESWARHYAEQLGLAAYLAFRAEETAARDFPRSRLLARCHLRRIEIAEVRGRLSWALEKAWVFADDLEDVAWGRDLQLAANYTSLNIAAKQGLDDVARAAERRGEQSLRALGEHRWEPSLRRNQAVRAIRAGELDRAHELMGSLVELSKAVASSSHSLLLEAHLCFADNRPDEGLDFLADALAGINGNGMWQLLGGFIRFAGDALPIDLRAELRVAHDKGVGRPLSSRGDGVSLN